MTQSHSDLSGIQEIQEETGFSRGTVHKILKKDLKLSRIAAKFVPKQLSPDELQRRVDLSQEWLDNIAQDGSIVDRIITGDESWICCFDPESKGRSSQWTGKREPRPKKYLRSRSVKKVMLTAFFDSSGVILAEFMDGGRVTSETYIETLMHLRDNIREKRPELWRQHNWILLDNNASPHTSYDTMTFHHQVRTHRGNHPPYSPDLAPSDFFLFPRMKSELRGENFANKDDLKEQVRTVLDKIPKDDFKQCFIQLQRRWAKCVKNDGQYFEGDRVEV